MSTLRGLVADGDTVMLRFTPRGVTGESGLRVAQYLAVLVKFLGFDTADYAGWGSGDNAGLLVIRADNNRGGRTLADIADLMVEAARLATSHSGAIITFLDASTGADVAVSSQAAREDAAARAQAAAEAARRAAEAAARQAAEGGAGAPEQEGGSVLPWVLIGGAVLVFAMWRGR